MLNFLKVTNFAVIESAELEFSEGFTCLTGETGAGKSLIVDALSLLSGKRTSPDIVRTGADKASVEAVFRLPEHMDFSDYELLQNRELILRRDITSKGRSRAYINGVMVPNQLLSSYAPLVFEIHGQHGQQSLLKESAHLNLFDMHVGLTDSAEAFQASFSRFKANWRAYWVAVENESQLRKELDFHDHQINEIDAVSPSDDDMEIESQLKRAENAELIRLHKEELSELLEGTLGVVTNRLLALLEKLNEFEPGLSAYYQQLGSFQVTFEDLNHEIKDGLFEEIDESVLQRLRERSSSLNQLYLKYGQDLNAVREERTRLGKVREELNIRIGDLGAIWDDLTKQYDVLKEELQKLNRTREKKTATFESELAGVLCQLSFPQASFTNKWLYACWPDQLPGSPELNLEKTSMAFQFSPNQGESPKALHRIASGGELSRIMLALIVSLSRDEGKALIFDEVDSGLGGETAGVVGQKLASLGLKNQVLCVTHLAQVARFAGEHWHVEKRVENDRTYTDFTALNGEERVHELARLLGGDRNAEGLRLHAREMLAKG